MKQTLRRARRVGGDRGHEIWFSPRLVEMVLGLGEMVWGSSIRVEGSIFTKEVDLEGRFLALAPKPCIETEERYHNFFLRYIIRNCKKRLYQWLFALFRSDLVAFY